MTLTILGRRIELASPVRIRRADQCPACIDRGWTYALSGLARIPPPAGCTGVIVCGCGAIETESRANRRDNRRRRRWYRTARILRKGPA